MQSQLVIPFSDLKAPRVEVFPLSTLADHHIRVRIDRFSVTANNVTYVALGKTLQYKDFFPTSHPEETMKMPVWGLGTVVESKHPKVLVGETLFGYFPAAAFCDMRPSDTRTSDAVIKVDRPQLPENRAVYNEYVRCAKDPLFHPKHLDAMIVFRPLWATSFYLDDYLVVNEFFKADTVIITSASSKTSFCLAQLLTKSAAEHGKEIIGLTSPRNADFVSKLGVYHKTVLYADAATLLDDKRSTVIVDVAGDASLIRTIAGTKTSQLRAIITVGFSHFDPNEKQAPLPAELQALFQFFFVPDWIQKRMRTVGPVELGRKMSEAWKLLLSQVYGWVKFPSTKDRNRCYVFISIRLTARCLRLKVVSSPWCLTKLKPNSDNKT
ncbi:hypothetical protein BC829DRAFT_368216 [Chytridium lagenaria]|nr:hypothetical protein BC829DRAFT_368216 [Chytridium lagenaria]